MRHGGERKLPHCAAVFGTGLLYHSLCLFCEYKLCGQFSGIRREFVYQIIINGPSGYSLIQLKKSFLVMKHYVCNDLEMASPECKIFLCSISSKIDKSLKPRFRYFVRHLKFQHVNKRRLCCQL